jgi:type II secretory pathway predicted ATPase ExeA
MDPKLNPFAPGAGYAPPELAGRAGLLERAEITIARIKASRPAKGLLLVGLRGVGKTVLLNRIQDAAEAEQYQSVMIECVDQKRLEHLLVPALRSMLLKLDRMEGFNENVKRSIRVLQGFISKIKLKYADIELSLDVAPEDGIADSGDLETDLPELFVAVGQAALARKSALALIFDEMQYLDKRELGALIMAMHKVAQKQMPIALFGAGLPPLLGHMGNSKSYAERLFDYPKIDPLDRKGVQSAIEGPVEKAKAYIDRQAIDHIANITQGYPYFVQQWAHDAWNCAKGKNIDLRAAQHADSAARKNLDEGFFSVRFDRLTAGEKSYLRAMAYFGAESIKTSKVASALGLTAQSANSVRSSLVSKGMIYSPTYGDVAFTVPMFDQYMRRKIKDFTAKD